MRKRLRTPIHDDDNADSRNCCEDESAIPSTSVQNRAESGQPSDSESDQGESSDDEIYCSSNSSESTIPNTSGQCSDSESDQGEPVNYASGGNSSPTHSSNHMVCASISVLYDVCKNGC